MGGADDMGEGLPYSQRLSNLGPGQTPSWTYETMQDQPRIEGVGVVLPDGTVFLCSGAENGEHALLPQCRTYFWRACMGHVGGGQAHAPRIAPHRRLRLGLPWKPQLCMSL